MYIFGRDITTNRLIDAFPCFICKKMIINAGLRRVVCSTESGAANVFTIEGWIKDWQESDIIDDTHQYGKKNGI